MGKLCGGYLVKFIKMTTRFSCLTVLLFLCMAISAQNDKKTLFEQFAIQQNSFFIKAYEERNTASYHKLLDEFTTEYNKLDSGTKKGYSNHLQNAFYNLACTYSIINNKPKALHYLKKSIDAGAGNYTHIQNDKDLDNIRNEKEYKKIVASVRITGDYLYILKRAGNYNSNDKREPPVFTYQPADDPNLAALRKGFNLDSIAGEGNDISKMINLMHWVHTLIPHDGNHPNPQVKNAMNMIAVCKKDNRGLNCRGLATVLNECYLAIGFKSRFVTCLPKDSLKVDPDCHVINMVYSTTLNKWVWMDPTNDAYVMNEKGELLSIEEVRERIIKDKPLILNPSANWNNKVSKTKEDYLYNYMAKNLYILQCTLHSEYDTETESNGKTLIYTSLVPLDYFDQQKDCVEQKRNKNNSVYRFCQTNNPAAFWQKPVSN